MEKVDLSIIILNYNSIDYLEECLESIKDSRLGGINIEVIVIDNASSDASVSIIKRKYKWVDLIVSKVNKGFAGGNNLAKGKAKGDYLLFLNPDTLLRKDSLRKVYDFMENNPKVGASTCRLEMQTGELDYSCHRGLPSPLNALFFFTGLSSLFPNVKFFSGYTMSWKLDNKKPHEVDAISGAFFFIRKNLADKIGWWDEDYFWYGEDLEFSYRVKEEGKKVMFLPNVAILHYKGVTSGIKKHTRKISKASRETRIRSAKASTGAMRIFYRKHYLDKYPKPISWLILRAIDLLENFRLLTS